MILRIFKSRLNELTPSSRGQYHAQAKVLLERHLKLLVLALEMGDGILRGQLTVRSGNSSTRGWRADRRRTQDFEARTREVSIRASFGGIGREWARDGLYVF